MTVFAEVVLPLPVDRSFQYRIPEILLPEIKPGCRVIAPFGRRMLTGFVVAVVDGPPAGGFEIKDIGEVLDQTPSFPESFLRFTKELSARSFAPWGEVLAAALPPAFVPKDGEPQKTGIPVERNEQIEEASTRFLLTDVKWTVAENK